MNLEVRGPFHCVVKIPFPCKVVQKDCSKSPKSRAQDSKETCLSQLRRENEIVYVRIRRTTK